jgi:hypothetical protein
MRRIVAAFRIFFLTLFRAEVAEQVERVLAGIAPPETPPPPSIEAPQATPSVRTTAVSIPKTQPRSEALTLLAMLQREARLVDFVKEPLTDYSDAQIGAVARDIHRDCGRVLERAFGLTPVLPNEEGSPIEVPQKFDAGRYKLTGKVKDEPKIRGLLVHHGWEAAKCELPAWSGSEGAARIVAPAEVEVQ